MFISQPEFRRHLARNLFFTRVAEPSRGAFAGASMRNVAQWDALTEEEQAAWEIAARDYILAEFKMTPAQREMQQRNEWAALAASEAEE